MIIFALVKAKERGFCPECVLFDSWYSSLDNLIRKLDWLWLTRLTPTVDPDGDGNRCLSEVNIEEKGSLVHLKAYGWIKVFKLVSKERGIEGNKQP